MTNFAFENMKDKVRMQVNYTKAEIEFAQASDGIRYAYRRIGTGVGVPIIYLNHLAANLDNCDLMLMNRLAEAFTVVSFDYQGIGLTTGNTQKTVADMARGCIAFIKALGYERVHLLGFSLGGFVAQEILRQEPALVDRVILAGTSGAGGRGLSVIYNVTYWDMFRGLVTGRDAKYYLFFPASELARRRGVAFLDRLRENGARDRAVGLPQFLGQLRDIKAWGQAPIQDLSGIKHRVWVVNGDHDRMVPTSNSYDLAKRLPNSTLLIYDGAGHGAIFQEVELFATQAIAFYQSAESN